MRFFITAYYSILRIFRDTKSLASMLLLPIVVVLILGNALSHLFEPGDIGKTRVCYLNNDKGQLAEAFDKFLELDEISSLLAVTKVQTLEEGKNLIQKNKVSSLIVLEEGLSKDFMSGRKCEIIIYRNSNNFKGAVIDNIVESFVNGAKTIEAVNSIGVRSASFQSSSSIEEIPVSASGNMPKAMDYYAVTMLVMTILYGAQYGVHGFGEDFLDIVSVRLKSAPANVGTLAFGKSAGTVMSILIQAALLIAFTKYIYRANWGTDILSIAIVCLTLTIFSVVLGTMLTMVLKNRMAASGVIGIMIPISTFLSGGYARIISDSQAFNNFRYILPSHLAQTAIFNSIYAGPAWQTRLCTGIMWAMIAVMFTAAYVSGRRRLV